MKSISKLLLFSFLFISLGLMVGCGTVSGFGEDVAATGYGIQRTVN